MHRAKKWTPRIIGEHEAPVDTSVQGDYIPTQLEWVMCNRKIKYSLGYATRVANEMNRGSGPKDRVHTYHCPVCSKYHVGH